MRASRLSACVAGFLAAVCTLLIAACGPANIEPHTLLKDARAKLDAASTVHFHVDSDASSVKAQGAYLLGGDGDAKRPDEFTGNIDASIDALRVPVKILSIHGTFYVQRPFSSRWESATPGDYGFNDPTLLLNRSIGLSTVLVENSNVQQQNRYRLNGEELDAVTATVKGSKIQVFVASADPNRMVQVTFGIDANTEQLRQVVINNLYMAGLNTPFRYTITLSNYNESLSITPPP